MSNQVVLVNEVQHSIYLLKDGGKQRVKAVSNFNNELVWRESITMYGGRADRVTRNSDHWSDEA